MVAAHKTDSAEALRREAPCRHRHIAAHRMPNPDRLINPDPVEQAQHIFCHYIHAVCAFRGRAVTMPAQVWRNHPAYTLEVIHLRIPDAVVEWETVNQQ